MKRSLTILFIFLWTTSAIAQVPKDFQFEYENKDAALAQATSEKIVVKNGEVTVYRDAIHLGKGSEKKKTTHHYKASPEQMEKLVKIIQETGFMDWPKSAEVPHKSNAQEYIQINMNGKTVRHTRWEAAHQEAFRILWTRFNDWYTDVRSVRF